MKNYKVHFDQRCEWWYCV